MSLDARLEAAATFIRGEAHADIGSDHAGLPIALLQRGRVRRAIVVEKSPGPLEVARAALRRASLLDRADLRLGDGFAPIGPGEVQSASLTGLGARTILGILRRAGERLPPELVLQPNDSADPLRRWARAAAYHLAGEHLAEGFWRYPVLHLRRGRGEDPAYAGLPLEAALRFGPLLLRAADPALRAHLAEQSARLSPLEVHARPQVLADLGAVREALLYLGSK